MGAVVGNCGGCELMSYKNDGTYIGCILGGAMHINYDRQKEEAKDYIRNIIGGKYE